MTLKSEIFSKRTTLELPPGAVKRTNNSGKWHIIFLVFSGRVTVKIGNPATEFSIGEGVEGGKDALFLDTERLLCRLAFFFLAFAIAFMSYYGMDLPLGTLLKMHF